MRKLLFLLFFLGISVSSFAQFRDTEIFKPGIKDEIIDTDPNFIFKIFSPERFRMTHSYSMSYSNFSGGGLALGMYTNSMNFRLADNLTFRLDASIAHSPYSSFSDNFTNQLTGFSISQARLDYQPSDNFFVTLQYQSIPAGYRYGYGYDSWNRFGDTPYFFGR